MKLKELWQNNKKPTISFEFFPARDEKAGKRLLKTIDTLAVLKPDFVSVTFGAGGSTREGSYQLAETLKAKNLEVLAYIAAYGLEQQELTKIIEDYKNLGIENILCVRGDQPEQDSFVPHPESFAHASELVTFASAGFDVCKGVAAYPEGHKDAPSKEKDLEYLKIKVDKGADFIITQYCYDNRYFFDFVERCRTAGIDIPIIAGVMPIYTIKMTKNLAAMCGATITKELDDNLAALPVDDKEALQEFSINFAVNQCNELIDNGVQGIHFYTMDRAKIIEKILKRTSGGKLFTKYSIK
jgi:methylenetetrahydrofolate reductase (NADH)